MDAVFGRLPEGNGRRLIINIMPQSGKALALDTPIATPTGWSTIGALVPGDVVWSADGTPTLVVAVSPVWENRDCYQVLSEEKDPLIADGEHEWVVQLDRGGNRRKYAEIVTTTSMAAYSRPSVKAPMIPIHGPLQLEDIDLPIPPYTLGLWLGDGAKAAARISSSGQDMLIVRKFVEADGYFTTTSSSGTDFGVVRGPAGTLQCQLREQGILHNKHIPSIYLRAGYSQRLALLQGLIDSDGHVSPVQGDVEFSNTNKVLIDGVAELVRSLGRKALVSEGRATLYGKDCGPFWRVVFYLKGAARLPRKAQLTRDAMRRPHRYIDIQQVDSVPTRCIQVAHPNGTFLAGRSMTPTHNSNLICQWFPVWVNELIALGVLEPGVFGLGTYEGTLAKAWGRKTRDAIENNSANLTCRVATTTSAMDEWETTSHGGMIARGVGGAFTGRPARRLVVDDLNKAETIYSQEERDAAWRWWLGVGTQRLHPEAPVIFIQARLHQDDVTGRLRSYDYEGDPKEWMVVKIPSIAEEETQPDPLGRNIGDPIYRPDVVQTREQARKFILGKESEVGSYRAQAQYRQRPTSAGGNLFKQSKFRSWKCEGDPKTREGVYLLNRDGREEPQKTLVRSCIRFIIFDLATSIKEEADFTVAGVFDLTPFWDLLLIDIYRDKLESSERLSLMREVHRVWQPVFIGIESTGFQLSDVQHARRSGLPIQEIPARGDKWTRALTPAARMDAGQIFFPPAAPWLASFADELLDFPTGVHDDQVDVLSYAAIALDNFAAKAGWSKS